ncbi:MAG: hypothetical protein QE285_20175 [Aquabacterium sp.]|nr:hypothetical protein [Aquabacterium sp.]
MKLFYFQDPQGNFGDDLNPWLWPRLAPTLFDDDEGEIFVGIGTLLNHRLPSAPHKHVFASGYGYGEKPVVDARWTIHAVRGPHTAQALGIPADRAVSDGALLLRRVVPWRGGDPDGPVGFLPTGQTMESHDWTPLCSQVGLRFISTRWPVERTLAEMAGCRMVLCEAMHGAIVADSLRLPWLPIRCNSDVLAAKWQDWLATVGLTYQPITLPTLYGAEGDWLQRGKQAVKRGLMQLGAGTGWTPPPPPPSSAAEVQRALVALDAASRQAPTLSNDALVSANTDMLSERLERLVQARRRPS